MSPNLRERSTKVTIHVENHFSQTHTNILYAAKPTFTTNQSVDPKYDLKNIPSTTRLEEKEAKQFKQQREKCEKKINKNEKNSDKNNPTLAAVSTSTKITPITVTYSKTSYQPTHSSVKIHNLPHYPQTLPRFSIFDYSPCLSQLLYFLISPTLMYQISYPRSNRIKFHFILRRIIELLSIGVLLLFFIEQFVKPTLLNSLHYFLSIDHANSFLKEKLRGEFQSHIASIPTLMNNTFSMIEGGVNTTLSKIINENITEKFLESTNRIANQIVDGTDIILGGNNNINNGLISHNNIPQQQLPPMMNAIVSILSSWMGILERILKLSLPNVIIWLLIFYAIFHSYLNLSAEIAQFGDRQFYLEWWNSRDLGEYWNTWNQPVYQFFGRHIFSVLVELNISTNFAKFFVFFISAVLHEVLIAIPMQIIAFHAFFGMLFQVPLVILTTSLHQRHNNPIIGNVIFWVSFVILGQPSLILIYFYQYLNTHGLLPTAMVNATATGPLADVIGAAVNTTTAAQAVLNTVQAVSGK
jgi:hypothetical protein